MLKTHYLVPLCGLEKSLLVFMTKKPKSSIKQDNALY